jgi:hypothetical protein
VTAVSARVAGRVARVLVSSVIDAPIDRVWQAIRRFDAVAELLPFVESSPIEDGREPTAVGAVRVVTQTDGVVFREVLVEHSDAEHFYSYTHRPAPPARSSPNRPAPDYAHSRAGHR